MKITESQLRKLIRQTLVEGSEGPAHLKQSATDVIAAINEDNPAAFWQSVEGVLEGLIMVMQHTPGADNKQKQQQASQFIEAAKQLTSAAAKFKASHQAAGSKQQRQQQQQKPQKFDPSKSVPLGTKSPLAPKKAA